MHGEMVSVGLMTMLIMENDINNAKKCLYFFKEIGLPFCFNQLKLNVFDTSDNNKSLHNVLERILSKEQWFRDNEPFKVTKELLLQSMQKVDNLAKLTFPNVVNSNNNNNNNNNTNDEIKTNEDSVNMPIVFEITGFGKFGNILDNPTTHLIDNLNKLNEKQKSLLLPNVIINSKTVLHVSGKKSKEMLLNIRENHNKFYSNKYKVVYLHLGVAASRKELNLETTAFNNTQFNIPDELGWSPMNEPICQINGSLTHSYKTRLNTNKLVNILKNNEKYKYNCNESNDAGLYVCNWIFYHSSHLCAGNENEYSLFVHVPLFKVISEEIQTQFVIDLVNEIAKMLSV